VVIVDTSVWIDYFRGVLNPHTAWLATAAPRHQLGLTDLILCEILQGVRSDSHFAQTRSDLAELEVFGTGGEGLAIASASNYRYLRAQGYTPRTTIDCIIATFCMREEHVLLHRDRDFDLFEKHLGLRVIRPDGALQ
jgi:predicted nucleic acid-binding protein